MTLGAQNMELLVSKNYRLVAKSGLRDSLRMPAD